jgi:hypothetical protein
MLLASRVGLKGRRERKIRWLGRDAPPVWTPDLSKLDFLWVGWDGVDILRRLYKETRITSALKLRYHALKTCGDVEVNFYSVSTSALGGGE